MVRSSDLSKPFYKPSEAARLLNLTVRSVQYYCDRGQLDSVLTSTGRRMITRDSLAALLDKNGMLFDDSDLRRKDVIYARVSTRKQKNRGDLDRQIEAVSAFAADKNPKNLETVTDVASGLNDNRKGLNSLLDQVMDGRVDRIFILYRDRLTRFGFHYLERVCRHHGTAIVTVSSEINDKSLEEELASDIISIIHSFSGKLYGMRRKVRNSVIKELDQEKTAAADSDGKEEGSDAKQKPQEAKDGS